MNIKLKLIIILLSVLIISIYQRYNTDIMSKEDTEDQHIMYHFDNIIPATKINDYKFVIRTKYNIVYENENEGIIKFYVRGTEDFRDIITDIKCYLGEDSIFESDIYKNSEKLLRNYKDKKIYLIGHSLGATIANRLANTYSTGTPFLNIIKIKLFCPYFAFEKEKFYNKDISVIENEYDLVPFATYIRSYVKSHDIKIIFKTIPTNTLELLFIHVTRFFYNIYDDNMIFIIDITVLVIFVTTLIYFIDN